MEHREGEEVGRGGGRSERRREQKEGKGRRETSMSLGFLYLDWEDGGAAILGN